MGQSDCRLYSKRPNFVREEGKRRLTFTEGRRVFIARTGREPDEPALKEIISTISEGLKLREEGDLSYAVFDENEPMLHRDIAGPSHPGAGRPPLPRQLILGVSQLVEQLGPRDAALLTILYGLNRSGAFLVRKRPLDDESFDVWEHVLRPLSQRLSTIAATSPYRQVDRT